MLRESPLLVQLEIMGNANNGDPYCIYGDPAYPLRQQLIDPYQGNNINAGQQQFNASMSACRQTVEWGCKEVVMFALLDFQKNLKFLLQPIGKYYFVGVLLTNCHICLYGNQVSAYFGVQPITLEEYMQ